MSISKAAKDLMVTPAAITMQIKLFERHLGFNLMYKEGRYIRLTEQGESVFKNAESIFDSLEKFEEFLVEIAPEKSGELRIGCHEVPARYIMPKLIDLVNQILPDIKVILEIGKTPVMLERLRRHEIPLALVVTDQSDSQFIIRPIIKREIILISAKNSKRFTKNKISISELQALPLIVMEKHTGIERIISQHLKNFGVKPKIIMETGSLDMLKDHVLKDRGLAFIEAFAIPEQSEKDLFSVVSIKEGSPFIEMGICYLKEKKLSPVTQKFIDLLDKTKLDF